MRSWRRGGALIAAALALAPASASAALETPIPLGDGASPNVTVDGAGAAHIVWRGSGSNSAQLTYCRLPSGAGGCSPRTSIAAPGDSLTLPLAFAQGSTIRVISYRYGLSGPSFSATMLFTSNDGGASFDAGTPVGSVAPNDYAFGPGDSVSVIDSATSCGSCYQALPLGGGSAGTTPGSLSSTHPYNGAVTMLDAATPLAVFQAGNGDTQVRRYSGSGNVNDPASWTPPVDIGPGDYPRLVTGPGGVYLITQDALSGSVMQARRFDGTTFGTRVQITTGTRADHASQDPLGRMHVVGGRFGTSGNTGRLFYASSDNGTRWDKQDITIPGVPGDMRLSVGGDHFGVVVGRYVLGNTGLFAARIGPSAAVPSTAKSVKATVVNGTVLVRIPPSKQFVQLRKGDVIPVGSLVDTTKGRVRITIAQPNGSLQSTDFFEGIFRVAQAKNGLATMALAGGDFSVCGARRSAVAAARSKKVIRHLWGDGKGKFRTKGRYAAASVRGTRWDTIDRCDGTLIRVTKGSVLVTSLRNNRTKRVVRAGQSVFVRA